MSDEIREGGSNAALTLGILSLIFIMIFPIAGLVMGIIGLRRSKMNERHSDAAWVLSVIGIVLNSLIVVFFLLAIIPSLVFIFGTPRPPMHHHFIWHF